MTYQSDEEHGKVDGKQDQGNLLWRRIDSIVDFIFWLGRLDNIDGGLLSILQTALARTLAGGGIPLCLKHFELPDCNSQVKESYNQDDSGFPV